MAKAPKPGGTRAPNQGSFLKLRLFDQTFEVNLSLPLKEAFVVRSATGNISLEQLVMSFGMDTFGILWWIARRQNGEPKLTYAAFDDWWESVRPTIGEDDFDLDQVDIENEPVEEDSPLDDAPG